MPVDIADLEQLIAVSEQRITELLIRIRLAEVAGRDTASLHRSLKASEIVLIELWKTRRVVIREEG